MVFLLRNKQVQLNAKAQAVTQDEIDGVYTPSPNSGCVLAPPFPLRDYQLDGIRYLRTNRRAMLCDQPRLGKTVQAALAAEPPVLIAAPTYLIWHWYDSLISYGLRPDDVNIAHGTRAEREKRLYSTLPATHYIVNIEMLRWKEREAFDPAVHYRMPNVRTFVVDESHHLRGRNSAQSQGALRVAQNARNVYLLTGTPVLNRPDDLFAQLRLLEPTRFTSYWKFVRAYCHTIDVGFGPRVVGSRDPSTYAALRRVFAAYSLTRTATDVGLNLAKLDEQVIRVEPDTAWLAKYKRIKSEYVNTDGEQIGSIAEAEMTLRRSTAEQKLKPLLSLLVDSDSMRSAIIFCKFKTTARTLAQVIKATCITGDETPQERRELAKDNLLVATIESLSEGIDLSHISTSIFFEEDYVPGRTYQALQRNALSPVSRAAYHLLVRGTIDEVIYKANTERTMTAREIVREALRP